MFPATGNQDLVGKGRERVSSVRVVEFAMVPSRQVRIRLVRSAMLYSIVFNSVHNNLIFSSARCRTKPRRV